MKVQFEIKDSDLKKMLALNELLFDGDKEVAEIFQSCIGLDEPVEIDVDELDNDAKSKFQYMMIMLTLKQLKKKAENAKRISDEQGVS